MKTLRKLNFTKAIAVLIGLASAGFGCENSDDGMGSEKGSMEVKLTDAPTDNSEIEAVFVTVTNIKVDGQSVSGFEGPRTINVMALQNGKTELLLNDDFKAGSYNSIVLELDFETDEDGNSPGTYIKKIDGTKQKLSAEGKTRSEYAFKGNTKVMENSKSTVVLDFDLRKFIKPADESHSGYTLATSSDLNGYLRFADENYSGSLKGTYNGQIDANEEVVVYIYKKGQFDSTTELKESNGIQFKNAVASGIVSKGLAANTYRMHFLDEGKYEVHFISYEEDDTTGNLIIQGELEVDSDSEIDLKEIEIKAGIEANINVLVKGILD